MVNRNRTLGVITIESEETEETRALLFFLDSPLIRLLGLFYFTALAIINALDTSLTRDELGSPEIYLALLLPIVRKYREERKETAAVYGFLLNRWQFLKDAESDLANARLNETRYKIQQSPEYFVHLEYVLCAVLQDKACMVLSIKKQKTELRPF